MAVNGSSIDIAEQGLTLEQERFLAVRLGVPTDIEAAHRTGVRPRTVLAWKSADSPAFREAYNNLGIDLRRAAVREIQALFSKAVQRLAEGLDDTNARTRAKYIELVFAFGGLARAADVNVNVVDRTRLLLEQIRNAGADVIEHDGSAQIAEAHDDDDTI